MATKPNQSRAYAKVPPFLRSIRGNARLTQRQLATKIGRPQWWVARIETGSRRVDVAEFMVFCEGCGTDPAKAINALRRA